MQLAAVVKADSDARSTKLEVQIDELRRVMHKARAEVHSKAAEAEEGHSTAKESVLLQEARGPQDEEARGRQDEERQLHALHAMEEGRVMPEGLPQARTVQQHMEGLEERLGQLEEQLHSQVGGTHKGHTHRGTHTHSQARTSGNTSGHTHSLVRTHIGAHT